MGCINSTRKLQAYKNENTFHVSIIRLEPQTALTPRHGLLELTPQQLIFTATSKEQIVWALQHLRRYGLSGNIFSFEAGRRSANGPGIYTFRCYKADIFYQKFQAYVNAASNLNQQHRNTIIGEITILRPNANSHTNHLLESNAIQTLHGTHSMQSGNNSFHNFPSAQSLEANLTERTQPALASADIPNWPRDSYYSNINPRAINKNIYIVQPLLVNFENNLLNDKAEESSSNFLGNSGPLGEVSQQQKNSSLETISTNYALADDRRYINVDNAAESIITHPQKKIEHYYENLSRTDLKQLLKSCSSFLHMSSKATSAKDTGIHYVVLDLDKSASPRHSTTSSSCHEFPVSLDKENEISKDKSMYNTIKLVNSPAISNEYDHLNKETSQSYSTIDFIKTCALIKSTINYPELNIDQDSRELRLTRHSK